MAAPEDAAKFREETPQMGQGVYMLHGSRRKEKFVLRWQICGGDAAPRLSQGAAARTGAAPKYVAPQQNFYKA
jgi:hypothetical protein